MLARTASSPKLLALGTQLSLPGQLTDFADCVTTRTTAQTQEDFHERHYLTQDVYLPALFDSMMNKTTNAVDFPAFLGALLAFDPTRALDARLGAVFDVLDVTNDDRIDQSDIVRMLQLLNQSVPIERLQEVAVELTRVLPETSSNIVTKRTFINMLKNVPEINEIVSLDFLTMLATPSVADELLETSG